MAQLPPEIERELMDLVFRHRDPLMSLDTLLRPYVDLMLRYGDERVAAERERVNRLEIRTIVQAAVDRCVQVVTDRRACCQERQEFELLDDVLAAIRAVPHEKE